MFIQGVGIERFIYRDVLISEGWNRGVPLKEMFSFQGVGFHCRQRCPNFRGWNRGVLLYIEMEGGEGRGGGWNRLFGIIIHGTPLFQLH